MYKVKNLAKTTWGLNPIIIKTIYTTVIEKVILYASCIWYNEKVKFKIKLPRLQRTALLAVTKCYRTVSIEAFCALSGCFPVHSLIEKEKDYLLSVKMLNTSSIHFNLNKKIRVNSIRQSYLKHYVKNDSGIGPQNEIYTDGSRSVVL